MLAFLLDYSAAPENAGVERQRERELGHAGLLDHAQEKNTRRRTVNTFPRPPPAGCSSGPTPLQHTKTTSSSVGLG